MSTEAPVTFPPDPERSEAVAESAEPKGPRCPVDGKRMEFHDLRTEAWPCRKGTWLCKCGGVLYEEWWETIQAGVEAKRRGDEFDAQRRAKGENPNG